MPLNFSTLILADTIPQEATLRQLLLYFETIFLYSPQEDIPERLPAALSHLYCHYAPVPFGDGLHNFQQLIRDMTNNRATYYGGGLSSLAAQANSVDEESVWRLVSRLSPMEGTNAAPDALLQARLLLKLAEVRAQEDQDIEQTLFEIDNQRQTMLQGLSNDDDNEDAKLAPLISLDRQPGDAHLEQRLRAWALLFLADRDMAKHWLLSTTPEVMAILADYATKTINEQPHLLLSLPLPGTAVVSSLTPEAYLLERRAWRQETSTGLAALAVGIKGSATTGTFSDAASILAQLTACHQKMSAWGGSPQARLELYLLPVSLAALLAKIAKVPVHDLRAASLPHGLVAVVQPLN